MDSLRVLRYALAEGRLMFRDRQALEHHAKRLSTRQLRWVAAHSPFTAQRFRQAGLPPSEWRHLPPTGKTEMMTHFDALNTEGVRLEDVLRVARRAEDSRNFTPTVTGRSGALTVGLSTGTSGMQGAFLVGREDRLRWAGVVLRHLLPDWPGGLWRPHRVAFLLRAEGGLYRSVQGRRLHFHFLDLLRPLDQLVAELSALNPTILVGPPSVLLALLQAGATARPQRVVSVAEVLDDEDAHALTVGFGPVVQVYQATEGLLALPCPHGELHLNEAHLHFDLEPLPDGLMRPVVTDLRRRAQPIIRHRLDDLLLLGDACSCGLAARRVLRVVGRQDDALELPSQDRSGRVVVWPDFLRGALARITGLHDYRLDQCGPHELRLQLSPLTAETEALAVQAVQVALRLHGVDVAAVQFECGPLVAEAPGVKRRRVRRTWRAA
ncbi:F390 synthetase-related protein [Deinococcus sonorensis]|uniref:F390 synthetase-related protein n=2 Tax=Deinococcus sonorensis TaxID=309891 RepID=A0AAU7U549_9DEIO